MISINKIQIYSVLTLASFALPLHAADGSDVTKDNQNEDNQSVSEERVLLTFQQKEKGKNGFIYSNKTYAYLVSVNTKIHDLAVKVLEDNDEEVVPKSKNKSNSKNLAKFKELYTNFEFFTKITDDGGVASTQIQSGYIEKNKTKSSFASIGSQPYRTVGEVADMVEKNSKKSDLSVKRGTYEEWQKDIENVLEKNADHYGYMRIPDMKDTEIEKVCFYAEISAILEFEDGTYQGITITPKRSQLESDSPTTGGGDELDLTTTTIGQFDDKIAEIVEKKKKTGSEQGGLKRVFFLVDKARYKELLLKKGKISAYDSFSSLAEELFGHGVVDITSYRRVAVLNREKNVEKANKGDKSELIISKYPKRKILIYLKEKGGEGRKYAYLVDAKVTLREFIKVILTERKRWGNAGISSMNDEELISKLKREFVYWNSLKREYSGEKISFFPMSRTLTETDNKELKDYLDVKLISLIGDEITEYNKKEQLSNQRIGWTSKDRKSGKYMWGFVSSDDASAWAKDLVRISGLHKGRFDFINKEKVTDPDALDKKIVKLHDYYEEFSVIVKVQVGNKKNKEQVYTHYSIASKKPKNQGYMTLAEMPPGIREAYFMVEKADATYGYEKVSLGKDLNQYLFEELSDEVIRKGKDIVDTDPLDTKILNEIYDPYIFNNLQVKIDFKVADKSKKLMGGKKSYSIYIDLDENKEGGETILVKKVASKLGLKDDQDINEIKKQIEDMYKITDLKAGSVTFESFDKIAENSEAQIVKHIQDSLGKENENKKIMFHAERSGFEHIQVAYLVSLDTTVKELIGKMLSDDKEISKKIKPKKKETLSPYIGRYAKYGFLTSESIESDSDTALFHEVTEKDILENLDNTVSQLIAPVKDKVIASSKKLDWGNIVKELSRKKRGAFFSEQEAGSNQNIEKVYTEYKELSVLLYNKDTKQQKRYSLGSVYDKKRNTVKPIQMAKKGFPFQHVSENKEASNTDAKNVKVLVIEDKKNTYRSFTLQKDIFRYASFEELHDELVENTKYELCDTSLFKDESFEGPLQEAQEQLTKWLSEQGLPKQEQSDQEQSEKELLFTVFLIKTERNEQKDYVYNYNLLSNKTMFTKIKNLEKKKKEFDLKNIIIITGDENEAKMSKVGLKNNFYEYSSYQELSDEVREFTGKDILLAETEEEMEKNRYKLKEEICMRVITKDGQDSVDIPINLHGAILARINELGNKISKYDLKKVGILVKKGNGYDYSFVELDKELTEFKNETAEELLDIVKEKLKGNVIKGANWKEVKLPDFIVYKNVDEEKPIVDGIESNVGQGIVNQEEKDDVIDTNIDNTQQENIDNTQQENIDNTQQEDVVQQKDSIENHVLFMFKPNKSKEIKYYNFGLNTTPLEVARKALGLGNDGKKETVQKKFGKKHYTISLLTEDKNEKIFKPLSNEKSIFEYENVQSIVSSEPNVVKLPENKLKEIIDAKKLVNVTDTKDSTGYSSACKGITITTIALLTVSAVTGGYMYYKKNIKDKGEEDYLDNEEYDVV